MMPQARTEARFYLLTADQSTGFDLMAECALCGAMTEQPLVVAWEMRHIRCSNCDLIIRFHTSALMRLREQAAAAQGY